MTRGMTELLERKDRLKRSDRGMKFTENCYEKVIEWIKEADKILVGFGTEWEIPAVETLFCAKEQWKASLEFQKVYARTSAVEEGRAENGSDLEGIDRIRRGYQIIRHLLEEKDYFLITTNSDAYIYWQGFAEERIVAPCGDIRRMQCEELQHGVWEFGEEDKSLVCPVCKKVGTLNVLQNMPYHESGYLEAWKAYQIWLQHTIHKKIVLLELGEGFQTPTVMRWPFEKLVFFQEKAILCCVHESLSMVSKEISERAYSVAENSIDFIFQLGKRIEQNRIEYN